MKLEKKIYHLHNQLKILSSLSGIHAVYYRVLENISFAKTLYSTDKRAGCWYVETICLADESFSSSETRKLFDDHTTAIQDNFDPNNNMQFNFKLHPRAVYDNLANADHHMDGLGYTKIIL